LTNLSDYFLPSLGVLAASDAWMSEGACRGHRDIFWPEGNDAQKTARKAMYAAKRICQACPVNLECREYALSHESITHGIWGGLTPMERRRIRQKGGIRRLATTRPGGNCRTCGAWIQETKRKGLMPIRESFCGPICQGRYRSRGSFDTETPSKEEA
jgi:WhiB family transcriptional regulator, redox-sensing transcriptional regulator